MNGVLIAARIRTRKHVFTFIIILASCDAQCGSTALIRAAENGHTEFMRLLLEAGANKDFKGKVCVTDIPHILWVMYLYFDILDRFKCCKFISSKYMLDVRSRYPFFHHQQRGATALYWAATFGHADCVRLLVDAGADTSALDDVRCGLISLY